MATPTHTTFALTAADGGALRGDVRTTGGNAARPAVVICHGFKGFKDWGFFPPLAERLARAGMTVVMFNFSGSGVGPDGERFTEVQRFARATVSNDLADLEHVTAALTTGTLVNGLAVPTALGVHGHSRGGAVGILFVAAHPECRALVTWSAISSLVRWDDATIAEWRRVGRLDVVNSRTGEVLPLDTTYLDDLDRYGPDRVERAARTVRVPWLMLHGDADETVPIEEALRLREWADPSVATLETVAGGTHTLGARHPWAGTTDELERAFGRTVEWFGRYLM